MKKYVVTADRDEHIRVSWYPQAYVIERFCLGHKKFVSSIHIPSSMPQTLISGGGDPTIKIWNWMDGKLIRDVLISDTVLPFIKVKPPKRMNHSEEYASDEDAPSARQRRKAKKAEAKSKQSDQQSLDDVDGEGTPEAAEATPMDVDGAESPCAPMLIVQKIESVNAPCGNVVLFSAVGATALFWFPLEASASNEDIRHLDFSKPILDFTLGPNEEWWVTLDGQWADHGSSTDAARMVEVIKFIDGQFVRFEDTQYIGLLRSLNGAGLLPASASDLSGYNLYSAFSVLPKNVDAELSAMNRDPSELLNSDTHTGSNGRPLSTKESARLRTKQVLLASQGVVAQGKPSNNDGPAGKKLRTEDGS